MSDPLRVAERRYYTGGPEEHVRLFVARMRAGELPRAGVIWAARLGHPAALLLAPDVELVEWADWARRHGAIEAMARLAGGRLWRRVMAAWACDVAERALPRWEQDHPEDHRPRQAVELVRQWAKGERVRRERLRAAAYAAHAAAAYVARVSGYAWQRLKLAEYALGEAS